MDYLTPAQVMDFIEFAKISNYILNPTAKRLAEKLIKLGEEYIELDKDFKKQTTEMMGYFGELLVAKAENQELKKELANERALASRELARSEKIESENFSMKATIVALSDINASLERKVGEAK